MKVKRVFETVLYAKDLDAAERFYREVLGLDVQTRVQVGIAFRCEHGVVLIFNPDLTNTADRGVPKSGAEGPGHIAFGVEDDELGAWRSHLANCGVEIEMEVDWDEGGRSIYFRDPAGNSVELAPPTLWGGGWNFR